MKTTITILMTALWALSLSSALAQTPFTVANASEEASLKKMKYDFPRETLNKNGGGYSLSPDLLEKPVKRVALVTFFLEDVGQSSESEMLNLANAWRTSDQKAQIFVDEIYKKGLDPLKAKFSSAGMELLTPDQFLDTPEKSAYYKSYLVEHTPLKKEKTLGANAQVSSSSSYSGGYTTVTTVTTKYASVDRIKLTPSNTEYHPLFFVNETPYTKDFKGVPLVMTMQTIGLYDKKQANSLGFDLCSKLEVDAVVGVYVVINKMGKNKEVYAVRSISGYMWGPNPVQREEGNDKGLIYTRGVFYGGARAFYGSGLTFQDEKKFQTPSYDGFDFAMSALGERLTHYLTAGER